MNKREFVKKLKVHLNMNEDDSYEVLNGVGTEFGPYRAVSTFV